MSCLVKHQHEISGPLEEDSYLRGKFMPLFEVEVVKSDADIRTRIVNLPVLAIKAV